MLVGFPSTLKKCLTDHVYVFLDMLYTVYNQPKAHRELAQCAAKLDVELRKIAYFQWVKFKKQDGESWFVVQDEAVLKCKRSHRLKSEESKCTFSVKSIHQFSIFHSDTKCRNLWHVIRVCLQ